ncbi:NAD(P)-dependent nickel-iron dehydrogenase catalytic subunit [Allochromatium warmingii]|uniref:NAD(P)-dependent nickel-iron dehydrogenase catalytic subunit n=1 Tax=Allochromatium warmingii TaxID=61595 RepID=A0A1H3JDN4_ALLWA|nr:Ni/Fe hydrogenase subunit alpha [Allochromatium warmingii]SDY37699.1 NAD(P)-dependent nickel-iron dehydrogenase catalytic subunit [Allochromatium warmingii]
MSRTITIEPVTRIEGHARITLQLDADGQLEDARFHLTQFRGFEKFCEGRPYREMPALTARTCGICPVSHIIASNKACDHLLAVDIPPTADRLRRIMNLAQLVQSHALSFFHLSSPDLLLGWDSDPATRNIFGVMRQNPELARDGIRLRQIGQTMIETLGGKKIHPTWVVPGGVAEPLSAEKRESMLKLLPEGLEIAKRTYAFYKTLVPKFKDEAAHFGTQPTLFLSLVTPQGNLEHYDGVLRVKDAQGRILEDQVPPEEYERLIGEAVEDFSYMKFPYYKPQGYPQGIYRVGPLARLNNVQACGTPYADVALAEFHMLQDSGPIVSSFHYHYARLVEILYGLEMIERLLKDPAILETRVRARARSNRYEGIGVSEAPRGTLMHHYRIDDDGLITWLNLVIATGHNNLAMNQAIREVAQTYVDGNHLQEGMLNRVEAVIRCYDPCLSCASHAFGQMPLVIELRDAAGSVVNRLTR